MVYRIAYRYVKNPIDADDVFSETFLAYFKKERIFESEEHRKAWLIRVTINCAKDLLEQRSQLQMIQEETLPDQTAPDATTYMDLHMAIERLRPEYREVIKLYYLDDLSVKEIAEVLNKNENTVTQKNVADYNVGEIVSTRLGNGLAVIEPGEVDVVTIAGMGGSLMIEILDAAPLVVDKLNRIILQPNVGAEAVRIWAEKNRWHIVEEQLVRENDRFSVIIAMEPGRSLNSMTPVELFLGPELLKQQHPLLGLYISEEYDKAQMVLAQLAKSDSEESRHKEQMLKRKWEDVNGVIKCRLGVSLS